MRIVIEIDDSKTAAGEALPASPPTAITVEPTRPAPAADAASAAARGGSPTAAGHDSSAGAAPAGDGDAAAAPNTEPPRELAQRAEALQALNAGPAPTLAAAIGPSDSAASHPLQPPEAHAAGGGAGAAAPPQPSGTFTNAGAARLN